LEKGKSGETEGKREKGKWTIVLGFYSIYKSNKIEKNKL